MGSFTKCFHLKRHFDIIMVYEWKRVETTRTTAPDTHLGLTVIFTIPEGKTAKDYTDKFYAAAKAANNKSVYYGFATNGNKLMCRHGYPNAEDFFAYMEETESCEYGDEVTILVTGAQEELDKIRPKLTESIQQAEITFAELDGDNIVVCARHSGQPDLHVTILPEFTVPEGKMDEFKAGFEKFYYATKEGTMECYYYGFAVAGDKVWCREGYMSAAGVKQHLEDVKEPLDEALKIVGEGGLKLNIVGPAAELEELRPALSPLGAVFWELDSQAYWKTGYM